MGLRATQASGVLACLKRSTGREGYAFSDRATHIFV